jgi:hypothetical protein
MRLTSAGNLGIGTSSPNVRTEVSGTEAAVALRVNTQNAGISASNFSEIQLSDNGAVRAYWRNVRDGSGATQFAYNSFLTFLTDAGGTPTERVRITSAGNIGIGTSAPGYKLEVSGTAAATDFNSTSDRTKKTNITTIENALEKVQELRGVEFDWINTGEASMGLIAQEVAEVIPQAVRGEPGNMTLSYGNLVGLLIEAVKAQQQQIAALQDAVTQLKGTK